MGGGSGQGPGTVRAGQRTGEKDPNRIEGRGSGRDSNSADVVVIGGGTVGGWAAWFLSRAGVGRVVVVERGVLGCGASSRAAGMVRGQGGTAVAVRLGMWSKDFYLRQQEEIGIDSGYVAQGYFMPAFDDAEVAAAHERLEMQIGLGLDVRWLNENDAAELNPTLARGACMGGTWAASDGYLDPPRNVVAYAVALAGAGVEVREHTAFTGLRCASGRLTGVETSSGFISTPRVLLTGGPSLAAVGRIAGVTIPSGATRHQVAVTEAHPDLRPGRLPMVFDVAEGLYWRPEEGGLLFGMSNPAEPPGEATGIDDAYLARMRARLAELVPVTGDLILKKAWAATIDYTPDHLPILGPAIGPDGPIEGATVASAAGHGMMWGPAVSRCAADIVCTSTTELIDATSLGLDRFDEHGISRLATDPIALPFPERTTVS